MTTKYDFQISKKAGEKRLYQVSFESDSATYTISTYNSVQVLDSTGADVTSTLILGSYTTFSGHIAQFMAQAGTAGEQYTVLVTVTMSDGEELIAEGILTVL